MEKSRTCKIENTIAALEQAIEHKKTQMHDAQLQAASANSNMVSHVLSGIIHKAGSMYGPINQALEQGAGFAQNFIKKMQHSVEENPWGTLRKAAVLSFGIGLIISRHHLKSPAGQKE